MSDMEYFDTDVLIHSIVNQEPNQHIKANDLIDHSIQAGLFKISILSIQEVGFVLAKLGLPKSFISLKVDALLGMSPLTYGDTEIARAKILAEIVGFRDFNDCIHTAIAERHCSDLYTRNYKDFKRIEEYTSLKIHYL